MISTSIATRRRLALLSQQQPSMDGKRQQQQEGSTDFQWVHGQDGASGAAAPAAGSGSMRLPSHRMPARAPVIGTMDDHQRVVMVPVLASGGREVAAQQG